MRIVIDLQGYQSTGSRHRGIGRYSSSLTTSLLKHSKGHEVVLVLSGLFPDTIEPIRNQFGHLLPPQHIAVWQFDGSVSSDDPQNEEQRKLAELTRLAFIQALDPDIVLVTSLFEGLTDNAVTSVCKQSPFPTAVVLYDLIPLIHRDIYLANPVVDTWYQEKLEHLKQADLLLSISMSSGKEAVDWLGFSGDRVVNISTAGETQFAPRPLSAIDQADLAQRYGLDRSYVMYTGGIDHRKNIEGLIKAYAEIPAALREDHQLAIVCSVRDADRERLQELALGLGLRQHEMVMTGFVSEDDLVKLYNGCIFFIFPSVHEGFGLPALEAMQCGKAVIASNTSSIPEVIGLDEALFDPRSIGAITDKLVQALTDQEFRQRLETHSTQQCRKFSWDDTAQRAISAMEACVSQHQASELPPLERPRLAYISPLPPARSGISYYSADLLRMLTRWYAVDVVVDQEECGDEWINAHCGVRSVQWFRSNHSDYDRVIFHFGNSHFHTHMFDLLEQVPGVVVLHDFFLSGAQAYRDLTGLKPGALAQALYASHGYRAVQQRFQQPDIADVIWDYPCNLTILQASLHLIVHSEYSRRLADQHYGKGSADEWTVIPLLRTRASGISRDQARARLGLSGTDFVVCSFGLLGPSKLNHRLLTAFMQSSLATSATAHLLFVGENHDGDYGLTLLKNIEEAGLAEKVRITGWADTEEFQCHLAAADVAVQLRARSRGETSAAVLDCMSHGLPTIINANGSMADIDPQGVWMLPDDFEDKELVSALEALWTSPDLRSSLGNKARQIIEQLHSPEHCAESYFSAIEHAYQRSKTGIHGALTHFATKERDRGELMAFAELMAKNFPPKPRKRQLLLDVSSLDQPHVSSGEKQALLSLIRHCTRLSHPQWRVEPIHADAGHQRYRYARQWSCQALEIVSDWTSDEPVDAWSGDVFLSVFPSPEGIQQRLPTILQWRDSGVSVQLLAGESPQSRDSGRVRRAEEPSAADWIGVASQFDRIICASEALASSLKDLLHKQTPPHGRKTSTTWLAIEPDTNDVHVHDWEHKSERLLDLIEIHL
ncbi:glycosyltransferase [Hydrogenophaga pseudoflava]|uniref:glycosyltransferase n=1 Tax=Hydrogenophaga pseudoflava TaxID=47421 RepID=UPI0027E4A701|nr:glycosyltransferase [Hydrogenophaga pseudoflava]